MMSKKRSKSRAKSKPRRSKSVKSAKTSSKSVKVSKVENKLFDLDKAPPKQPKAPRIVMKRVKLKPIPGSDKWAAPPDDPALRKKTTALLIIDMQNDFLAGGSLAVPNGNNIIPKINKLRKLYDVIFISQDWHPAGHVSFGSTHSAPLFTMLNTQMMWPDHCVQNTAGAKLHKDLVVKKTDIIIKKGANPEIDAYSAFFDNDHKSQTKLHSKLKELGINSVDVCGLAYDYCVGSTALDAKALGYNVRVIKPATASVSKKSEETMTNRLLAVGVSIVDN
jgi:nicotinamidase/pyrazinamidase